MAIYRAHRADEKQPPSSGRIFLRRLGQLIIFAGLAASLLWGVLSLETQLYGARARVQIEQANKMAGLTDPGFDDRLLASQVEVLRSREIASRLARKARLDKDPAFNRTMENLSLLSRIGVYVGLAPNPDYLPERERVMRAVQDRVRVQRIRSSNFISVGFRAADPQKAALLANRLAETYVDWLGVLPARTEQARIDRLRDEMALLKTRIAAREELLLAARPAPEAARAAPAAAIDSNKRIELRSQLILKSADRKQIEARLEQLREALQQPGEMRAGEDYGDAPALEKLLRTQDQVRLKTDQLSDVMLPSHPQLRRMLREGRRIEQQVASTGALALERLQKQFETAKADERQLMQSLEGLNGAPRMRDSLPTTADAPAPDAARRVLVEADRRRLAELQMQLTKLDAVRQEQNGRVRASIVTMALPNSAPVFPKTRAIVLLGALSAFVLGGFFMLIKALLFPRRYNRRWNDPEEGLEMDPAPMPFSAEAQRAAERRVGERRSDKDAATASAA